jgi:hypothetical protein
LYVLEQAPVYVAVVHDKHRDQAGTHVDVQHKRVCEQLVQQGVGDGIAGDVRVLANRTRVNHGVDGAQAVRRFLEQGRINNASACVVRGHAAQLHCKHPAAVGSEDSVFLVCF